MTAMGMALASWPADQVVVQVDPGSGYKASMDPLLDMPLLVVRNCCLDLIPLARRTRVEGMVH